MKKKIIVIAGPTAVGKTKYAIDFAKKNNGEIISLDSVQVYKGLDIGSAKITKEEMQGVPHYMIDEVDPKINLNVKDFKDMAKKYIDDIFERGKLPILVGGTGFYIRAVLYDTDFLKEDDDLKEKIRTELLCELKNDGIDKLYEELKSIDFDSWNAIPKGNVKRILRAIEFYRIHKFPISKHNMDEKAKESKYDYDFYLLDMDREKLYKRINNRVDDMMKKGLLPEVKNLIDSGLTKDLNSMKSIGYSELYDFCSKRDVINDVSSLDNDSKKELNEIIELIKQHTRNYAKRQMTWFRAEKKLIIVKKF